MRVLIAVTHLLGAGHLTRAAALARALAAAGHETVLVSGGAPARLVRLDGARLVQLPPLHVRGTAFGRLLDETGGAADLALRERRRRMLLTTLEDTAPDVVVTELFPFGRRGLAEEFLALVEAARARDPRPVVLASVRDILVAPDKTAKVAQAHERIARLYDGVLVHGDPALAPLDASWPVDEPLRRMLRYTGYVDEGGPVEARAGEGIVVAAGSSAAGLGLFQAAAEAARRRPELGWRILAGHGVAEEDFSAIGRGLAEGVLTRARLDYRALLARAAVSVSQCGYNTAVDLLAAGPCAVLVPFEAGRETEQRLRAEKLAARGLAQVLPEAHLTAGALLDAVTAALARPPPLPHGIDLTGAARSVAIIEEMAHPCARPMPMRAKSGLDRLRATLDAAAERSLRVPVWWRDDDAVAATPALDRLLRLAQVHAAPILVAAIPAAVEASLGRRIARASGAWLAVHGLAHANHAPAGAKPSEFGPHRPLPALIAEAVQALRLARERLPGGRLLPVFVPPWNRLSPELAEALPSLGYAGVSAASGLPVAGLVRADIRFDPIDWRGTRSLTDPGALLDGLARTIAQDPGRPLGLLTHHLAHDEAVWDFLADLLPVLLGHTAVAVLDPADLFSPAAVDAAAAWSGRAPERSARTG